jgi:hypothetical protein
MNQFFSVAILLAMLTPQNQNLPETFYKIPEPVRETATLVVSGTFGQGRTPCMFRPDGTRVWGLDSWFTIKRVHRGEVGSKSIRVNTAMLPKTEYVSSRLKPGQQYLLLLRPREETLKKLKTAEGVSFFESLREEEIIAIMELK